MRPCKQNSKKTCMNCKHYEYCDRANLCNGDCGHCDDDTCENNPNYKELTIEKSSKKEKEL